MADVANSPKITASVKFPATLWDMIHKCKSGAISWGRFGNCVKIKKCAFEKEYLTSGEKFSSFIRQLNLYGFRKLHQVKYVGMPAELYNDVVEYQHRLFVKGHPELLLYIRKKVSKRKDTPKTVSRDCTAQTSSEVSENADQQETHSDKSKLIHDEKLSIVDIVSPARLTLSNSVPIKKYILTYYTLLYTTVQSLFF